LISLLRENEERKDYLRFRSDGEDHTFLKELFMKISARNMLKGKIIRVIAGAVNTEVDIELPRGTRIVSVITKTSAENMDLKEGKEVYAVIKASNVMIATD
jgi:molybdopterin-binding protein